ncbi:MAG: membrane protein required for colicin V production [Pseudohongiellaceae bacterium]|jgi:membrane protein required for colicin V production
MIDIIIVGIVVISALLGVFRGLIKEALSLASWFAAIVAGTLFSSQLADLMENLINNPSLRRIAAFALLFIVVIFTGTLISNLISKLTEAAGLKGADRTLGALFGVLRGMIIVLVIIFICSQFDISQAWFDGSKLVPHALAMIDYLQGFFGLGQTVTEQVAA